MTLRHLAFLFLLIACFTQCTSGESDTTITDTDTTTDTVISNDDRKDVHSYAEPAKAKTKHLDLNLAIDFEQRVLKGFAQWTIENNNAKQIVFDVRDLNIEKVTLGKEEQETTFKIGENKEYLGAPLTVDIQPTTQLVTIYYSTTPDGAAAVDWLDPEQTADKKHPFMFTQGQAILTRAWIPCQDSPGIRITYNANIKVDPALMAVMSASNPTQKNEEGIYQFEMKQAIPPYLLALAAGDIAFSGNGPRTGIYAEPSVLQAALREFETMETMVNSAERLYGTYKWDRFDVIILPPSFPFGGMENPRLTFATPTIIAGDGSLASLIAHELAHSWSGNLVTNATWNDFWLNEGFTVYFERRIMEEIYGRNYAKMLAKLGFQDLENTIADLGADSKDTHLFLDLDGRDPDDGMTDIAYEKGASFLTVLEKEVGRKKFDAFLNQYFTEHAFQTITTKEFIAYLTKNLLEPNQVTVDINEWIYGPGIPKNVIAIKSTRFTKVEAEIVKFEKGAQSAKSLETSKWSTHEWLHFIRHLAPDLAQAKMTALDNTFGFANSGNSEIQAAWYELSIHNGYSPNILPQITKFLVKVGRRKFLTPLYRAFVETNQIDTARKIYQDARPNYHSVSRQTIDSILMVQEK